MVTCSSLMTGRRAARRVMTGEITGGKVLPVGGSEGTRREARGIAIVVLPERNRKDVEIEPQLPPGPSIRDHR
jgi:ATP-dependent Lon protease